MGDVDNCNAKVSVDTQLCGAFMCSRVFPVRLGSRVLRCTCPTKQDKVELNCCRAQLNALS